MPIGNPIQKNNDTRVISATATTGQTDFTVTGGYTINAIGVFRNGVRLNNSTDFTAADGSTVSLNVACDAGDTVTFHIFDKFTVANAIVGAASTQTVFGNLTLNGELYADNFNPTNVDITGISTIAKAIIGTGVTIDQSNIDTVGIISATTFNGSFVGSITGAASQITVADESSDTTCFPTFVTAATGNLPPKSGTNLTFNSSSGALTATSVNGNIVGGTVSGTTGTFTGNVDIAGDVLVAADIKHTGDTDTKIYFATDTIKFDTAGSERLRIASDGKIGIGINDPERLLHLSSNNTIVALTDTAASTDEKTKYILSDAGILGIGKLNDAYDTATEYLRIDNSGRLLLGTQTEGYADADDLTIATSAHTGITIRSGTTSLGTIAFSDATSGTGEYDGYVQYSQDDRNLRLGTAGSARLFITSDGRVLIGGHSTASIVAAGGIESFTTAAGNIGGARFVASALGSDLSLAKSRNATVGSHTIVQDDDTIGTIKFRGSDGGEWVDAATISCAVDGTPGDDDMPGRLVFYTTADGAATSTERLRIDSKGMIGIGGVTPKTQNTFDAIEFGKTGFLGSQTGARTVEMASNAYYNSGWKYKEADVATQYYQYTGYHAFTTAASGSADAAITFTERLRINSTGRVLVGAGAIAATSFKVAEGGLQVSTNGASGAPTLNLGADGSAANTQTISDNTVKDFRMGFPNYDIDEEPLASMLGFVGAGTSLQGTDCARIHLGGGTSYLNAVNQIRFYTTSGNQNTVTGTERVRITHGGDIQFHRTAYEAGTVEQKINYYSDAGTAGSAVMGKNCEIALVKKNSWDTTWTSYGEIVFRVNGDSRGPLDEAARFTYGGDLKFTTGNGVTFDDSSTSAVLDDYEEGTWTPSWVGTTNHGTTSYGSSNSADYVKIGNTVYCRGYSQVTGNSGGTGYWIMDNLPFVSPNDLAAITTGSCMMENFNFPSGAMWVVPYKPANNDNMYLYYSQDNGVWDALELSDDTAFYIIWSLSYRV